MASSKDYYEILGVDKQADDATIRKAFHKKARDLHPDINKEPDAEERFKEVNEAYEVLSDPKKREFYDRYGSVDGYGQGPSIDDIFGGGFDMGDLFSSFFGGAASGGGSRAVRLDGRDMGASIKITLQQAATGCSKEIAYNRLAPCHSCNGSGCAEGGSQVSCSTCHGTGQVVTTQRSFLGQMQVRSVCPDCNGTGVTIDNPCTECQGQGRTPDRERVSVKIPAGFRDGQQLRVEGYGEAGVRGARSGDLIVTVIIEEDERFQRSGDDLHVRAEVSIAQAALGATLEIEGIMPDEVVEVTIPAGSQFDDEVRVQNMGMPHLRRDGRGDLIVHIDVVVPQKLNEHQRKLLEELAESMNEQVNARRTPWQRLRERLS
ncbi:MAG: molecular chaperone DnaJ [Coriobacteriales bacterium]|nr:molecular chaperone DnaJ [Coriobacteriales bacterium]